MPKVIVTHKNPDLDAIMSAWLLVRFDQSRYGDAELAYVPAGTTYKGQLVDSDQEVVHVDCGGGKYDHHQPGKYGTCASELVRETLVIQNLLKPTDEAVKVMVEYARQIDTFEDCYWQEAREPRFAFTLAEIIPALHRLQMHENEAVTRMVFVQLDGVYQKLKDWYKSQQEIARGQEFESVWGKGVAVESGSDDIHKVAQRAGYEIVVVGDTQKEYLGIKTAPKVERSLRELYDKIVAVDGRESWFYHNSGHMLLHGSDKGSEVQKSSLSVAKILLLIKEVSGEEV